MEGIVNAYSTELYNALPSLGSSTRSFADKNGRAFINGRLRDLFQQHKVTEILGPILVHRHFRVKANELLVDVNGTSSPWTIAAHESESTASAFERHGGLIKAASWTVDKNSLVPYEFSFESGITESANSASILDGLPADFIEEFIELISAHNLNGIIGLNALHGEECRLEFTEGTSNITVPMRSSVFDQADSGYLPVAYKFAKSGGGVRVILGCAGFGDPCPNSHTNTT